jgi:hypothetical protein
VPKTGCFSPAVPIRRKTEGEHDRISIDRPSFPYSISLAQLRTAVEQSWDRETAYLQAFETGNPALGQCYPTARLVQWFFPQFEIVRGVVVNGQKRDCHFWNMDPRPDPALPVDLSWDQFPLGSSVEEFEILDRLALDDSAATIERCEILLKRVLLKLAPC